ncbi:uncharacterized protein DFL_006579 [Arthrobotrys flagrans]|uniref:DUF2470 domain-containing protein n=1 Tax=Arthrobotrys flagrans TaxID=97331 RepID=A0A436ZTM0_ARTFL|nr:hypothetical protein DFL_006579 [Arthrobotrys flagrans]
MASEDAVRTRILNHMNKDHVYDSKLYLIHRLSYPKTLLLPSNSANVRLSDIQTTHLTITIDDVSKEIPFDPPMASLSDSRVRLVGMTKQAEAALGVDRDMISIKPVYLPPRGVREWTLLFTMLSCFYLLFNPSTLQPNGLLYSTILRDYPWIADAMYKQVWWGYWVLVTFHVGETLWFCFGVLAKFWEVPGVDAGTAALWTIDVAIHGFYALNKWKRMVKRQVKKNGKKDH